jgi:hypothetical protein
MKAKCKLRITEEDYSALMQHLFPGDFDEHGAVLLAGLSERNNEFTLLVREIHFAREGIDYVSGQYGYRALSPKFIHQCITRARDERLVYLAVHNHMSDRQVAFSYIDLESHQRGYPALLQIARGMPVGALVFGNRSVQADLWLPDGRRLELDSATVIGNRIQHFYPFLPYGTKKLADTYDRQIRLFGKAGQEKLSQCRVGIIGLGGIGSLLAEYLARLGINEFYLIDDDHIEETNRSRVLGATATDVRKKMAKVLIAKRNILKANKNAVVHTRQEDVSKEEILKELTSCDYLFLAADSMRARLAFNALVHQYLIPGVQVGSKIRSNNEGRLEDVMSANRPVRPGCGCLWCNQLIDPTGLAKEAKTDEERKAQAYGAEEPNPSVISLNAVSAAHAVNDFMLDYLNMRPGEGQSNYEHFHFLKRARNLVQPRKGRDCSECSREGLRFGRGDSVGLPSV